MSRDNAEPSDSNEPTMVRLEKALEKQIDYFVDEYDLTIGETLAALEMVKAHWLFRLYKSCEKPKEES